MSTQRVAELEGVVARQECEIDRLQKENSLYRQKIDALVRRVFGSSSEKLDANQPLLFGGPTRDGSAPPVPAAPPQVDRPCSQRPKRHANKPRLPENLPVIELVIDPPEVLAHPEAFRCIGEEVSERLNFEPGKFELHRTIRRKFVPREPAALRAPIIAPLPPVLLERCLAAPGLLAYIFVSKYCDHLPLYRLEDIFYQRYGVYLPRQTMCRWLAMIADWLRPIYDLIRAQVLGLSYFQVDESPIEYLDPGHGQTRLGYFWICNVPRGAVFFAWYTSRSADCLQKMIGAGFQGILQCDGYAAYASFAKARAGAIVLAGCWAHARRKFFEAKDLAPYVACWVLRHIQNLYAVEAKLREQHAGPRLRLAVRAAQSHPIIQRLRKGLERIRHRYTSKELMGGAIDYALNQWENLEVYLQDGRVEIDNNLVENAIRPTAVGKKNWLFVGEATAGEHAAIFYTLVENCRREGIDTYAYLRDILTRLPSMTNQQLPEITPAAWAKERQRPPPPLPRQNPQPPPT